LLDRERVRWLGSETQTHNEVMSGETHWSSANEVKTISVGPPQVPRITSRLTGFKVASLLVVHGQGAFGDVVRFATLDDRLIRRERGDGGIGVGCKIIRQKPL
jgi:hypothetical protein